MRWAIFENTEHRTREAHLCFESGSDNHPILVERASLFPDEDDEGAYPCVVSPDGVCRRLTDGFRGFDGESLLLGFEEAHPKEGREEISSADDIAYPLGFDALYPKNVRDVHHGWLSPEGDTYSCLPDGHAIFAHAVIDKLGQREAFVSAAKSDKAMQEDDWLLDHGWAMIRPPKWTYERIIPYVEEEDVPVLFTTTVSEKQIEKIQELGMWTYQVEKRARRFEDSLPF